MLITTHSFDHYGIVSDTYNELKIGLAIKVERDRETIPDQLKKTN
jgi:hypothetical protein